MKLYEKLFRSYIPFFKSSELKYRFPVKVQLIFHQSGRLPLVSDKLFMNL